jgi:hypothetical protein
MAKLTAFVAYPSSPYLLTSCIVEAVKSANKYGGNLFTPWEENDIAGRPLTAPIFQNIESSQLLVADITKLNFNVTYEIGYAIGRGKRVFLIRNKEFAPNQDQINKVGIFDTLGYETYSNAKELEKLLVSVTDLRPLSLAHPQNRAAPVYVLETPLRGGVMTHIIARIKKARMQYRSFAPAEESRLSALDAIHHVAASFGVVVPLLGPDLVDADVHNIRGAYIAGLSHGMSRRTLILQDKTGPIPLDVRDFAKTFALPTDIDGHIHAFSLDVFESTQQDEDLQLPVGNLLSQIAMGDPMAENEFQTLGHYYLQTNEFQRAVRGEVNLVVGRKGTGKTALFSQVRNKKRKDTRNVVVDLKPEGYQLLKLKEQVLDYLAAGAKAHLITAFWEYLLYLEITYKVLEKDQDKHLRDASLYDDYVALRKLYEESPNVSEGDFSERLLSLSDALSQQYSSVYGDESGRRLTTGEVTELLHSTDIRKLEEQLSRYLHHKSEVWVLVDNLDKGWSTNGLARGDITILRCLIDAARKIEKKMRRDEHEVHVIIFVRNDVYQLLMDESSDFGKESRASLDWADSDLLRELLRKRLIQHMDADEATFNQVWSRVCVSHYLGDETSQFLIERSLMRPRNLLKLFAACRGFAVNLQHDRIEAEDLEKGLAVYSSDLVVDADQELTDIEPQAKRLIYQFVGETSEFSHDDLNILLELNTIDADKRESVIEFLLYYGFLGIQYLSHETEYIYHVGYDMQIMKTRLSKNKAATKYILNPAFWPALRIAH